MLTPTSMPCRLCDRDRPLCRSHIIPEFLYKPLYDAKNKVLAVNVESERHPVRSLQKGLREELLCEECEQFLNDEYEKPFLAEWREKIRGIDPERPLTWLSVDYRSFKLFHLSILWRAGVASREEFRAVNLGDRHSKVLRKMIVDREAGPRDLYGIWGCSLVHEKTRRLVQAILSPFSSRDAEGHRVYSFAFGGCAWFYVVSSHQQPLPYTLSPSGKFPLTRLWFQQYDPIRNLVTEFHDRFTRKTGLSTRHSRGRETVTSKY